MHNAVIAGLVALCSATFAAHAQQAPAVSTTVTSQPGRVAAADVVRVTVVVTAVNKDTRALTLKNASGKTVDLVAGPEVRNFEQIKVGDQVVVQYVRALTLELRKGTGPRQSLESSGAVRAKLGEKPAGEMGERVTVLADVVDVNPTKKTITLKGMKGKTVVLDVQNPDHFKVVKKGDQVEVDYAEALAIAVEPAPKAAAKK